MFIYKKLTPKQLEQEIDDFEAYQSCDGKHPENIAKDRGDYVLPEVSKALDSWLERACRKHLVTLKEIKQWFDDDPDIEVVRALRSLPPGAANRAITMLSRVILYAIKKWG